MRVFVKCQCRDVEVTRHADLHRDAEAGGLFCGRCKTVMAVRHEHEARGLTDEESRTMLRDAMAGDAGARTRLEELAS